MTLCPSRSTIPNAHRQTGIEEQYALLLQTIEQLPRWLQFQHAALHIADQRLPRVVIGHVDPLSRSRRCKNLHDSSQAVGNQVAVSGQLARLPCSNARPVVQTGLAYGSCLRM